MIASGIVGIARVVAGAQARWVGCAPSTRQRIYFANHTSHLDFVVLWAALPHEMRRLTRPVAARDYWGSGVRRHLAVNVFRAVLVHRPDVADVGNGAPSDPELRRALAQRTVEMTATALGTHESLIIFPEGTRGDGVAVAPFKSGLYHLCRLRPDVELVPAWLENMNRILPKGEVLPVPLLGAVTFGAPLLFEPGEAKETFLGRARAALLALRPA